MHITAFEIKDKKVGPSLSGDALVCEPATDSRKGQEPGDPVSWFSSRVLHDDNLMASVSLEQPYEAVLDFNSFSLLSNYQLLLRYLEEFFTAWSWRIGASYTVSMNHEAIREAN